MKSPTWLLEFKRDVHSQTGEDGVIEKILATLPATDKWCVEFGAWDGLHLTNTRALIESQGYSAVLIEADRKRFRDLQKNSASRGGQVIPLNRFVGFGDDDNLDVILGETPLPHDFDLLSIDIDGNDYHVWRRVTQYRPKAVVVEFNPTIPTEVKFVQPADPKLNQGCSLASLVDLGKEKGYELVCVLRFNAFFVKREYFDRFEISDNSPAVLRTELGGITHLFVGYDGTVFLRGARRLAWHGLELKEDRFQALPSLLRKYPEHYGPLRKLAYRLFQFLRG